MTTIIYGIVDFIALKYRPAAVIFVVLPLSALLRTVEKNKLRLKALKNVYSTPEQRHEARAERVAKDIQNRKDVDKKICTSRSPFASFSMRFSDYKKKAHQVYVGDFDEIIKVNEQDLTIKVEPLCTVGQITDYLVHKKQMMMCTTLEVKDATIGGLAMAVAMTTSSHKYGLLQETVLEYEVILSNGQIVKATRDNEYSDLFHAIPFSHGSLCLLISLTLKCCRVKPYVKVTYEPFVNFQQSAQRIRELARYEPKEESSDFIEATLFSRTHSVVMNGRFADYTRDLPVNHVGAWYAKWFYTRVRDIIDAKDLKVVEELVPTFEYIFRHDRAIFWTLKDMLPEWIGNNVLFRYLLGWMLPPKIFMLKFPAFTPRLRQEMRTERVYQDIVLPLCVLEDAVEKGGSEFEIWPILVYPSLVVDHGLGKRGIFPTRSVRNLSPPEDICDFNGGKAALFFDLGVYGIPHQIKKGMKNFDGVKALRNMEKFTTSVGGAPFLYADTFMSPKEFLETFDLELYEKVREKYNCKQAFFDLYEKTTSFQPGDDLK